MFFLIASARGSAWSKNKFPKNKGFIFRKLEKKKKYDKIRWVDNVKALGVVFGFNIDYEELWMQKFTKFKTTLTRWMKRELSLKGKKILIKAYFTPVLAHLCEEYTEHIPEKIIKLMKQLVC